MLVRINTIQIKMHNDIIRIFTNVCYMFQSWRNFVSPWACLILLVHIENQGGVLTILEHDFVVKRIEKIVVASFNTLYGSSLAMQDI